MIINGRWNGVKKEKEKLQGGLGRQQAGRGSESEEEIQ